MKIVPVENCAICQLHLDPTAQARYEIECSELWVLRHHPDPAPLPGWLFLDSSRHCSGPLDLTAAEASDWGCAIRDASDLAKQISGCERVYATAFDEGAQHLHLHLIPCHLNEPASKAWAVADLYRDMDRGEGAAADHAAMAAMVQRCRHGSASRVEAFARLGAVGDLLEIA